MRHEQTFAEPPAVEADGAYEARAMAREFIWERLADIRKLCDIGQGFAELGDDRGLQYAMARLIANTKIGAQTFKEMTKPQELAPAKKSEAA
jgi:hypothetical protein